MCRYTSLLCRFLSGARWRSNLSCTASQSHGSQNPYYMYEYITHKGIEITCVGVSYTLTATSASRSRQGFLGTSVICVHDLSLSTCPVYTSPNAIYQHHHDVYTSSIYCDVNFSGTVDSNSIILWTCSQRSSTVVPAWCWSWSHCDDKQGIGFRIRCLDGSCLLLLLAAGWKHFSALLPCNAISSPNAIHFPRLFTTDGYQINPISERKPLLHAFPYLKFRPGGTFVCVIYRVCVDLMEGFYFEKLCLMGASALWLNTCERKPLVKMEEAVFV